MLELTDQKLITRAIDRIKKSNFLHSSTIITLEAIKLHENELFTNNTAFVDKIMTLWGYILHDAIHTLKHQDYRELIHQRDRWNGDERDSNNEFVFGIDKLCYYFKKFTEFEKVLYGVDSNYRDHVVHVFRVWLIGICLLDMEDNIEKIEIDQPTDKVGIMCSASLHV